jgi:hypothetical protein
MTMASYSQGPLLNFQSQAVNAEYGLQPFMKQFKMTPQATNEMKF